MKLLFWIFILGIPGSVSAQFSYTDSLKAFQKDYKEALYTIINQDTAHIVFYPIKSKWKVTAKVTLLPDAKPFKITTSSGKLKEARQYAQLQFTIKGKTHSLYVYQLLQLKKEQETAEHLFIPFTDKSSGKGSYGGGRYISLLTTDLQSGTMILDFNKAYNPYCAFTTGYNCPIPPQENFIPLSVKAGEQYDSEKFIH